MPFTHKSLICFPFVSLFWFLALLTLNTLNVKTSPLQKLRHKSTTYLPFPSPSPPISSLISQSRLQNLNVQYHANNVGCNKGGK
ncbi:hypothetical protein K469DRAFT_119128 [Zopfia rhizophila CBS 207.26]|uniref:Uncharacterized protein n=1 Tax=Zopfia rhizophila CBS 207.26 TaxID=1314779 RepID=A0A6A6E6U3_9PEZI|nr:hypothetical protein K469DRAFT_119128 [Zopfia rhizophila CBS 207.26]